MCRRLLASLALLGAIVLSDIAYAERRQIAEIEKRSAAVYVDMGVELRIVERDEKHGRPMVPGNPERMRLVGEPVTRGGIMKIYADDAGNQTARKVRASKNPVVWFASQAQADLILHDGPIPWALVQGSEGSGKTTVLAMWTAFRVLEHIGHEREIGITAPTHNRLGHVKREIKRWWRPSWYRFSERNQKYTFLAGPSVQLVSAVQRSEEAGSPIQGANWVAHAGDEFQDHFSRDGDIIARGRSAPNGRYLRLNTSTFKDSPDWRTFRDVADKAQIAANDDAPKRKLWSLTKLYGLDSPFISPEHWQKMRAGLTDREYQRRVLAMDVGPERQVYYSWSRVTDTGGPANLRPLPLNAVDVTARELSRYGPNLGVLLGHDPGARQHVTEVLKAYEFPGERRVGADGRRLAPVVRWFVVDEITSDVYNADTPTKIAGPVTVEHHADCVLKRVREKWGCLEIDWRGQRDSGSPGVVVRIDPHTTTGENHPDRNVYTQWRAAGFTVFAAAYNTANKPTPIKVEARIDLLLTLLCNIDKERRLFVLCDEHGRPAAPMLVRAFETMERDAGGRAEWEDKNASDLSHWPAAVAFALHSLERPRIDAYRNRIGAAA